MADTPERILIRGVNWIGDAVLTIPAIKSIRRAYPKAHICLLAKPWTAEIFIASPDIDEVILYEERFSGLAGKLRLAKLLRKNNFDHAILLQNAFDAAFITWLARIPVRIGYRRDWRGFLLTSAIPVTDSIREEHQVYYYLNLVNSASIETVETEPYINLTNKERAWARSLLRSAFPGNGSPLIGINPGATYGSAKRWLPERFAELIKGIISDLKGHVVLVGSAAEVEIAREIIAETKKTGLNNIDSDILLMSGKTSLRELAALISECTLFVTNDSGPMHMSSALFVPTIAIFGSTRSAATGPVGEGHRVISKGLSCSPCMERECPEGHVRCMADISAGEVLETVKNLIPEKPAVFLDKDGTLIEDKHYLNSFDNLVILPKTKQSLTRLVKAGFMLIGITNQSGIARGIVDEQFVKDSNTSLKEKLGIEDFFYCPHHPDDGCSCRKPEPLMIRKACLRHRINLRRSYVIGDKESDVLLAHNAGATGVLLSSTPLLEDSSASYIAENLDDAVGWILQRESEEVSARQNAL